MAAGACAHGVASNMLLPSSSPYVAERILLAKVQQPADVTLTAGVAEHRDAPENSISGSSSSGSGNSYIAKIYKIKNETLYKNDGILRII